MILDAKESTLWPTRLRLLGDGRLMMLSALSRAPAGSLPTRAEYYAQGMIEPVILVSDDEGGSRHQLEGLSYSDGISSIHYYPRCVQTRDGYLYMFAHAGGYDAPYGTDLSIVMERFRIRISEPSIRVDQEEKT